jgi:uncharacterized protein DUF2613
VTKLVGTLIAAVLGLLISGIATWQVVSAVTKAPAANPANQAPVVLYGSR